MQDERIGEARRLASEMRRIIERMVLVDAPVYELTNAADAAKAFADRLEELLPKRRSWYEVAESSVSGEPGGFFDRSPIIGLANPLAAPLSLTIVSDDDGTRVEGRVRFGAAYEGPPGNVHGGIVAAVFDEALGMAQSLSGQAGFTGTLTVRYRSPTPLYEDLRVTAWVDRVDGRKIFTSGTCHAGDRLTAEAEGIFITVRPERFEELLREREEKTQG
jgi:acyl-coenzyme A thioesterase PaaI-like protein